jgi:hypothetical protein
MNEHNIRDLYLKGVCVTINSDDPSYFGGYLADNYLECQKHLNFSFIELIQIAKNSFHASFLSEEEKLKRSITMTGQKKVKSHGANVAKANIGNISINKDDIEKKVKQDALQSYLDQGWQLGGKKRKIA